LYELPKIDRSIARVKLLSHYYIRKELYYVQ